MANARWGWRGCLVVALIVAGVSLPAHADAQRPPFLGAFLQESRVLYPLQIGDWRAQGEQRYDQAEAGASVRYQLEGRKDLWMDVFFYPSGVVFEPQFARAFAAEVEQVAGARRQQGDTVEIGDTRVFDAPGEFDELLGSHAPRTRSATFELGVGQQRYHSLLAMGTKGMYFVKLRFSAEPDVMTLDEIRGQGEGLLAGFLSSTQVFNTGNCWRNLPVDVIADGAERPDSVMASANDGTDHEVWVAEDRILLKPAALADDDVRASLAALGAHLHAAVRGRCQAPETMDVDVPEGMREIRFEYRAPAKPGDRPAVRSPTRGRS